MAVCLQELERFPMLSDDFRWEYDPAEHRFKHCWNRPYAEVTRDGSTYKGKCPSTLSKVAACDLVNDAEYEGKNPQDGFNTGEFQPKRIWNIHEGVVYEAVPTQSGSYHGYPWCGKPGANRLPIAVRIALAQRAAEQGFEREFKAWMKRYA